MGKRQKKPPKPPRMTRHEWLYWAYEQALADHQNARDAGSHQAVNNMWRFVLSLRNEIDELERQQQSEWDAHDPDEQAQLIIQLLEVFGDHPRVKAYCEERAG